MGLRCQGRKGTPMLAKKPIAFLNNSWCMLAGWLVGWLAGWLVGWLTRRACRAMKSIVCVAFGGCMCYKHCECSVWCLSALHALWV